MARMTKAQKKARRDLLNYINHVEADRLTDQSAGNELCRLVKQLREAEADQPVQMNIFDDTTDYHAWKKNPLFINTLL